MDRNRQKYGDIPLINHFDNKWELTFEFKSALSSKEFKRYFEDAINVNLLKLQNHPTDFNTRFIVGEKYYRTDVIKLLNWSKEQNGQNVGGYIMRSDSKFLPVFIALEKTEKFQNKMAYEDSFLSRSTMRWFSKSGRSTTSKTESKIISNKNFGMIQLFVKKSDDDKREGKDFYYLGSARVIKAEDKVAKNSDNKKTKLIDFTLRLQREVDLSLYRALIES
ncbi:DNA helicase [Companilactobacillus farciminis]|nr:DNA helicase [Companilactobacillus farciminis]